MSQSKKGSLLEAFINAAIGYGVAIVSQIIIFPLFDIHVSLSGNLILAGSFTVVSIIRSYTLRRLFNYFSK